MNRVMIIAAMVLACLAGCGGVENCNPCPNASRSDAYSPQSGGCVSNAAPAPPCSICECTLTDGRPYRVLYQPTTAGTAGCAAQQDTFRVVACR